MLFNVGKVKSQSQGLVLRLAVDMACVLATLHSAGVHQDLMAQARNNLFPGYLLVNLDFFRFLLISLEIEFFYQK